MSRAPLRVVLIPADRQQPARWIEVDPHWQAMAEAIGAEYIEHVRTPYAGVAMLVDEEGRLTERPVNQRVSEVLYPDSIAGDVLVCAEIDTPGGRDLGALVGHDGLLRDLGLLPAGASA